MSTSTKALLSIVFLFGAGLFTYSILTVPDKKSDPPEIVPKRKPVVAEEKAPEVTPRNFNSDFEDLEKRVEDQSTDDKTFEAFSIFVKTYELKEDPDRMLWVYDKYADLLDNSGRSDLPEAPEVRAEIIKEFHNLKDGEKKKLELSKPGIAKSLFMDSEDNFLEMIAIVLSDSEEKVLKKKLLDKQALKIAVSINLEEVIELNIPRWSVAANYRLALLHVDLGKAIRNTFIPPGLKKEETEGQEKRREQRAKEQEILAVRLLEKSIEFSDVKSPYSGQSRILLEELRAKMCPTEDEIDALHSSVWQIDHGTVEGAREDIEDIGATIATHLSETGSFKKKLGSDASLAQLSSSAKVLRKEINDWFCVSRSMRARFDQDLGIPTTELLERLSVRDIEDTFDDNDPAFFECSKDSHREGRMTVDFAVKDGRVIGAIEVPRKYKTSRFGLCVQKVISELVFPKTKTEIQHISYKHYFTKGARFPGAKEDIRIPTKNGISLSSFIRGPKSDLREQVTNSGLTAEEVKRTISGYDRPIRLCGKSSNKKALKGTIKISFYVMPNGRVLNTKQEGLLKGTDLARCVQRVVATMEFPKTNAKKNKKVSYPFRIR